MGIIFWALNFWMKEGQYSAVSKPRKYVSVPLQIKYADVRRSRSVVGLVNYNSLHMLRRKFGQASRLEQSLIRCDGSF